MQQTDRFLFVVKMRKIKLRLTGGNYDEQRKLSKTEAIVSHENFL